MKEPTERRRPRAFDADDPALDVAPPAAPVEADPPPLETGAPDMADAGASPDTASEERRTFADMHRGFRWGGLLVSALTGLAMLGIGAWFARLAAAALARDDIIGWTAKGLLVVAGVSASVIILREIAGLMRLNRLSSLKRDTAKALATGDVKGEREGVRRLRRLYDGRDDYKWRIARFAEHEKDVHDAGALAALAERELVTPLDGEARRTIMRSAKRVSVVTALSPIFFVAVLYVLIENVRMLRALATLYGGRPGLLGALRLGRMVIGHIIATGGLALTDDLVGQFLGQDLVRRLSRRLGEGVFNGALTARIGAAAIDVCRPLPFIEAKPIRVRDLVGELMRRSAAEAERGDQSRSRRIV